MMRWYLLLPLLMLLAACTQQPPAFEQYVGTNGVLIRFQPEAPPGTVAENKLFPVRIELQNKGATGVETDQNRILISFASDPLYITGGVSPYDVGTLCDGQATSQQLQQYQQQSGQQTDQNKSLRGRSYGFPDGEAVQCGIPLENSFRTKPVFGQRESPETTLTASVCYAYRTNLSATVCIDTNQFEQNVRAQACKGEDLTFTGGQGAPIEITQIEVKAWPVISQGGGTTSVRPEFIIHLKNSGNGTLIGTDDLNLKDACILRQVPKDKLSAVRVNATMGTIPLTCGYGTTTEYQGVVQLNNNEGEITCTVPDEALGKSIFASTQNFLSTLQVTVTYLYKSSTSTSIKIQRIPGAPVVPPAEGDAGQTAGYAYVDGKLVLDPDGKPMTLCTYYDMDRNRASQQTQQAYNDNYAVTSRMAQETKQIYAGSEYGCTCSADRCLQLNSKTPGSCILTLCPIGTQCCTDAPQIVVGSVGVASDGTLSAAASASTDVQSAVNNIAKTTGMYKAIQGAAQQNSLETAQVLALLTIESHANPNIGPGDGGLAIGIAQFHPPAAFDMGLCDNTYCTGRDDRKEWSKAIPAAARYLKQMQDAASAKVTDKKLLVMTAAAGYNGGLGCISNGRICTGAQGYAAKYLRFYAEYVNLQ
jgi:hypothetical protein